MVSSIRLVCAVGRSWSRIHEASIMSPLQKPASKCAAGVSRSTTFLLINAHQTQSTYCFTWVLQTYITIIFTDWVLSFIAVVAFSTILVIPTCASFYRVLALTLRFQASAFIIANMIWIIGLPMCQFFHTSNAFNPFTCPVLWPWSLLPQFIVDVSMFWMICNSDGMQVLHSFNWINVGPYNCDRHYYYIGIGRLSHLCSVLSGWVGQQSGLMLRLCWFCL